MPNAGAVVAIGVLVLASGSIVIGFTRELIESHRERVADDRHWSWVEFFWTGRPSDLQGGLLPMLVMIAMTLMAIALIKLAILVFFVLLFNLLGAIENEICIDDWCIPLPL